MANFITNPATSYFATANQPKTITVRPAKQNIGVDNIIKRLKISAPGFTDKYITLVQRAAPPAPPITP